MTTGARPDPAHAGRAIAALAAHGHDAAETAFFHGDLTVKAYAIGRHALVIEGRGRTDVIVVGGGRVVTRSIRHAVPVDEDSLADALARGSSSADLACRAARRLAALAAEACPT